MSATHPALASDSEIEMRSRSAHFHPLEVLPWFRGWRPSIARDLVYTFVWNLLFASVFVVFSLIFGGKPSLRMVWQIVLISQCIGFAIHALFFVFGQLGLENVVLRQGIIWRAAYYTALSSSGVFLGFGFGALVLDLGITRWMSRGSFWIGVAANSLIISLIIAIIYFWRERSLAAEMRLERERGRAAVAEREASLANLRALQAQIEPHFLFNTLANVTSLIHPAPDRAKLLLESFIHYLRASLATSRESITTLGADFALMRQFLAILQIRMGERLRVEVDLPDALAGLNLPPMLLQPLVENAIKHGLEPKVEGGTLSLSARDSDGRLRITVADSGVGFSGATSAGIGLKNVRERLHALFGDAGRLIIEEVPAGGTRVVLEMPLHGALRLDQESLRADASPRTATPGSQQ